MSPISQTKIRELHNTIENPRLDFKLSYQLRNSNDKTELAKDATAIANYLFQTSGRGHLIIGTDDNGRPIGINPIDYPETRVQQIIASRTDPPPTFDVNQVNYSGVNLVVIELKRNHSGPHQLKRNGRPAGFPIRRGSTTDMMTSNEVFQAMQMRGRSFTRQRSEYETLSPNNRYRRIMRHCRTGLVELGISSGSITRINYAGGYDPTALFPPRVLLRIIKVINSRRWNLYLSFHAENANQNHLISLENSILGFIRANSQLRHRSIFIHFIHGTLSSSYFTNRQLGWSGFIRVDIEPRITYFGCGEGISGSSRSTDDMYIPKFFVSCIKSEEDMKTRIELILNWIEQHQQMFEEIRTAFQR